MAIPVPQELLDFLKEGKKIIIAGHKEPDGDCVGSQLALASVLQKLGKEVILCSAGPFKRTEILAYKDRFADHIGDAERDGARVIIMDCSAPSRTGDLEKSLEGLPTAVIDHHESVNIYKDTEKSYIDPLAPSTTFLTLALIEALGVELDAEEAETLFFGLCTDTGFFRHIDSSGSETFECAARMIRAGANPKEAFHRMYGGKSLESRHLLGFLLSRAKTYFDGKLVLTTEEYYETQHFGLEGRDSDSLYQLLQAIDGVEAIAVIRQESPDVCTAGLRSRDKVDVAEIAALFGGGGHKNAAGLSAQGTIETVRPKILAAFEKSFAEKSR